MKRIKAVCIVCCLTLASIAQAQQHDMQGMKMTNHQMPIEKKGKKAVPGKKSASKKKPVSKPKGSIAMPGMKMDQPTKHSKPKDQSMKMPESSSSMPGMDMDHGTMQNMDMNNGGMNSTLKIHPGDTIKSTSSTLQDHLIHAGKRVNYDLVLTDTIVHFTGKKAHAMAINGQIPGPLLQFTEGDTAYIRVYNRMKMETSVHWHGILVPNQYDGVPYITTAPIKPGHSYLFKFPLRQTGTYWYHSHTMLDEQSGLYGLFVVQPQHKTDDYPEQVLLFSDWINTRPREVLRLLKRGTDWYSIQRGSVLSYGAAIRKGYLGDKLKLDRMRMPAMDILDVKYDRYLANGKSSLNLSQFKPGQTVRLRIVNGSAASYFWLNYAGGKMTVVSADGLAVKPFEVDKILIGTAENYDVLIKIPADGKYEFRATVQDIACKASVWLGSGKEVKASDIPKIPYFRLTHTFNQMMSQMKMPMNAVQSSKVKKDGLTIDTVASNQEMGMKMDGMDMGMHQQHGKPAADSAGMKDMNMSGMQMNGMGGMRMQDDGKGIKLGPGGSMMLGLGGEGKILSYDMLRANSATTVEGKHTVRTYQLYLTGNMLRYVWAINNKVLSEADRLLIRKGEVVRFVLHNATMMEHPMHLHGHFFRVLNTQGAYSPLKHTISVEPMQTQTIEFLADEQHDWFFHCHTLYHMASGMARIVRYEDSPSNPEVSQYQNSNPLVRDDKKPYFWAQFSFHSQTSTGSFFLSNTRYEFNANYRFSYDGRYEIDPRLQRYIDNAQYFAAYIGGDFEKTVKGRVIGRNAEQDVVVGLRYLLPYFIQTDARVSAKGRARLTLSREDIPLTSRLYLGASYNTDNEFQTDARYILRKNFALSVSYDNQYGFGGGLTILY